VTRDIGQAQWWMQSEITALWQACFSEKREAIDLFFARYFRPENTLTCSVNGRVVAMLHMLPGVISTHSEPLRAHYIYAAATDPAFRAQGIMEHLIVQACELGAARGDHYSFLLPANERLYDYYGKHAYVPFFRTSFNTFSRMDLQRKIECVGAHASQEAVTPCELKTSRDAFLAAHIGSAIWSEHALDYAVRYAEIYGGQLVAVEVAGRLAYALCSGVYDQQCEVLELVVDELTVHPLLAAILKSVNAATYRFRLLTDHTLLGGSVSGTRFGMIKPLTALARGSALLTGAQAPYLGLTLD